MQSLTGLLGLQQGSPQLLVVGILGVLTLVLFSRMTSKSTKKFSREIDAPVKPNEGRIRRSFKSKELVANVPQNFESLYELLQFSGQKYRDRKMIGWRDVVGMHDEEKEVKTPEGHTEKKQWQFYELGSYKWLTYEEVAHHVLTLGRGLVSAGCQPGKSRVAIYCNTRKEWQFMMHGCFSQSIGVVTVYASLGEEGLTHSLKECEVEFLFTSADLLGMVKRISAHCPTLRTVFVCDEPKPDDVAALQQRKVQCVSIDEVKALGETSRISPRPPRLNDICITMYTSGTTGTPKGVMMTHGNLISAMAGLTVLIRDKLQPIDTFLAYLPLAHVLELVVETAMFYWGMHVGYGSPRTLTEANVRQCKGDLRELRPTAMVGVPAVWETIRRGAEAKLAQAPALQRNLFWGAVKFKSALAPSSGRLPVVDSVFFAKFREQVGGRLHLVLSGGAALSGETQKFMRTVLCCPFLQGYGLTETCGMGTIIPPEHTGVEVVGEPVPCVEIKLVDIPDMNYFANANPPRGEIHLRGPAITRGYYMNEAKTREDFDEDGWFHTGDIGEWKPDGILAVIDRKKNLVKLSGGEYVALERLEIIYGRSPFVDRVCVVADSNMDAPVAVVLPHKRFLEEVSSKEQLGQQILKSLVETGRSSGLKMQELVTRIIVAEEEWTPENDMLTAAMKLKRQTITQVFKKQIASRPRGG